MRNIVALILVLFALDLIDKRHARTTEPTVDDQLVGTWKLVSVRYGGYPDLFNHVTRKTVKHVTPTHSMTLTYVENGTILSGSGGTYTLKEGKYTVTLEYGIDPFGRPFKEKGESRTFNIVIDGTTLRMTGTIPDGGKVEELWERIEGT